MFPETVGRSLEEVEEIFQSGHVFSAWKIGREVGLKRDVEEVRAAGLGGGLKGGGGGEGTVEKGSDE